MEPKLERILYVEDDESIAQVVIMTLEDIGGFDVRYCSSGTEALACILEYDPQLILMDVMMPVIDGPQTFAEIKKIPEVQDVPLVFMTAKAQVHEQAAYMELGAIGIIVKPFDPMSLAEKITTLWAAAPIPARHQLRSHG